MTASNPLQRVRPLIRVRQTRHFTPEPPTASQLEAISEAARWSGSSQNTQPWRFIVLRDRALIERIAEVGMPLTRALTTASAAIAIAMPTDPGHRLSYAFDEGRAAERILIAATFVGLRAGVCWPPAEVRERIGGMIGIPRDRSVRTIMAIGHPTAEGLKPNSPPGAARLPHDEVVLEPAGNQA